LKLDRSKRDGFVGMVVKELFIQPHLTTPVKAGLFFIAIVEINKLMPECVYCRLENDVHRDFEMFFSFCRHKPIKFMSI
jgi:hypothetical protein